MGRIIDLCGEVAAAADDGVEGLELPLDERERLLGDWTEDDLDDALALVRESLLQSELVESADSLSARLLEFLGRLAEDAEFAKLSSADGVVTTDEISQLARRVDRLEEILEIFRDDPPPDRAGFDVLRGRLADVGIEAEMAEDEGDD